MIMQRRYFKTLALSGWPLWAFQALDYLAGWRPLRLARKTAFGWRASIKR